MDNSSNKRMNRRSSPGFFGGHEFTAVSRGRSSIGGGSLPSVFAASPSSGFGQKLREGSIRICSGSQPL